MYDMVFVNNEIIEIHINMYNDTESIRNNDTNNSIKP